MKKISILVVIVFFSCNQSDINTDDFRQLFSTSSTLNLHPFNSNIKLLMPGTLKCYKDSLLLLFDTHLSQEEKYNYRLFSISSKEDKGWLVPIGIGPNEVNFHSFVNFIDVGFSIFDPNRGYLGHIYFREENGPVHFKTDASYRDIGEYGIFELKQIDEEKFICMGLFKKGMYGLVSNKAKFLGSWGEYPNLESHSEINNQMLYIPFQGNLRVHPKGDKFVFASKGVGLIEFGRIFDDSLSIIKRIHLFSPKSNPVNAGGMSTIASDNSSPMAFNDIEITNNYIFCLYSHRSVDEYGLSEASTGRSILVFDWEGNPIHHFKLSSSLSSLALSLPLKSLFGVEFKEDEFKLVWCKLPEKYF